MGIPLPTSGLENIVSSQELDFNSAKQPPALTHISATPEDYWDQLSKLRVSAGFLTTNVEFGNEGLSAILRDGSLYYGSRLQLKGNYLFLSNPPSSAPTFTEWPSGQDAFLAYLTKGEAEKRKFLGQHDLQASVIFDERLISLEVLEAKGEKVFLAMYSGLWDKNERYVVVGRNNNPNEWREIRISDVSQINSIKSLISMSGYENAILNGKVKSIENFSIKPVSFIQSMYSYN